MNDEVGPVAKNTIYHLFDRDSPGSIKRKHENNLKLEAVGSETTGGLAKRHREYITSPDVVRVIEANPELVSDPVIRHYILEGLRGKLRSKPGRPAVRTSQRLRIFWFAPRLVKVRIRQLKRERGLPGSPRKLRGDAGLTEQAYEDVARMMNLPMGGPALRNLLSSY